MSNDNLNLFQTSTFETTRTDDSSSLAGKMLSGKTGQYAIHHETHHQAGVRTYTGVDLHTHTPVIIKEYYSFWWTTSDLQQIELALEHLDSIDFHSGGVQDFRLLLPQESIASLKDHRCYLVLRSPNYPTRSLRSYLESQDTLTPKAVHHLLSQVLQSLWFLHSLPLYFDDDTVQKGMAHGNLCLDSLLITIDPETHTSEHPQFQVYLQDLNLWETAIWESDQLRAALNAPKQQDLQALGTIATQLFLGELDPPEGWNPFTDPRWQEIPHDLLKLFIQQLTGSDASTFSGAKAARGWLLSISPEVETSSQPIQSNSPTQEPSEAELADLSQADKPPFYFKVAFAIVCSALFLNLGFLWFNGAPAKPPILNFTKVQPSK